MKDCLHSYMKIGIVHFMAFSPTDLDGIRKVAEDDFFGGIEITSVPEESRADIARLLQSSKLAVGFCSQPIQLAEKLDLNSSDAQKRGAAVSRIKKAVDEAYALGASKLAVLSGWAPEADKYGQAKELLVDSLNQVCDYARSKGDLGVVLETFDRDYDKRCLIGPTREGVEVAAAVRKRHPDFGLMIDLSHLPMLAESPEQALKTARDYLVHVHAGNCIIKDKSHPAYGDKHPPFGAAGGENDVEELRLYLQALMDIGYIGAGKQNIVAFEVKPLSGESSEAVIANAKRTLREAWARL